ncbi:MAG: hypothetical protein ACYTGG_00775 [Planctomycetota bacterium]|jgi:hypothetical protein
MISRRQFLGVGAVSGFAALGAPGISRRLWRACAAAPPRPRGAAVNLSAPSRYLSDDLPSVMVNGMPFAEGCPDGGSGTPEEVDIVIVRGGISGPGTAMLMRDRFGGVAQGEWWQQTGFSLGNACVITPDPGTFLEDFYNELGLQQFLRVDEQDAHIEIGGDILGDFFDARSHPPPEWKIFFVNQDNWALPAVENCLLDAEIFVPQVLEGLEGGR